MVVYKFNGKDVFALRILVTGAAGFVGSNFVRRTLETRPDSDVTVVDSLTYAGRVANLDGIEKHIKFVHGDILNSDLVDRLVPKSDLVVHFAAESHNDNSLDDSRPFIQTNINGTFNLIEACVKHSTRFHHISTDEVFGDLPLESEAKFTESTPYRPSSPYSASKAASDLLVRAWVRSLGLQATITNCSNNYGPYQHEEKFIPRTVLLAARGIKPTIYGDGLNVRDWIHVDDHTDGVWAAIEKGKIGETYLLGANGELSNLEVVQIILKMLSLPTTFMDFVPDRPGHDRRYAVDASKAEMELGWVPKHDNFESSLAPVVEHYKKMLDSEAGDLTNTSNSGLSVSKKASRQRE